MFRKILLLAIGASALACNKVEFAPATDTPTGLPPLASAPQCWTQDVDLARPVNVLFIVDQSGSNVNGPYEHPGQATDPQKALRSQIMVNFLNQHSGKLNLRWSLITFNDDKATAYVQEGGVPGFTSSMATMGTALNSFFAAADVGRTPYRSALQMARQMIAADSLAADPRALHLVAFITDGYPTDYCPGGTAEYLCPGRILDEEIDADVAQLVASARGSVQLGTVYYGASDTDAASRLRRMATRGNGQFVDLNQMSHIDLNDVIRVPQTFCDDE